MGTLILSAIASKRASALTKPLGRTCKHDGGDGDDDDSLLHDIV